MTLKKIAARRCRRGTYIFLYETRIAQSIEQFSGIPEDVRAGYTFVLGHVGYGLHAFLPQPVTYATILREPIERIVSYYYYILRMPNHFLHEPARQMGLKGFACSEASAKLGNGQTKYLAELDGQVATRETLERVKENLQQRFSVVGLIEAFDKSLLLLRRATGWGIPCYSRENVTHDRPRMSEIPQDALDAIAEHNAIDVELYAWGKDRFQRDVEKAGLSLRAEVAALRAANRVHHAYRVLRGRTGASADASGDL